MSNQSERLEKCQAGLRASGEDAWLISNPANVTYLSGFTGTDTCLLITRDRTYLITDFRYVEQASLEAPCAELVSRRKGMFEEIAHLARAAGVRFLGFEKDIAFDSYKRLRARLARARLVPLERPIQRMREIKSEHETSLIESAIRVAERAYRDSLLRARSGQQERDLAARLHARLLRCGADSTAFPTIVASGPRSSLPHAQVSDRTLRPAEPIIVDWGAAHRCYRCDLTRTFFIDKMPPKAREIYAIVLEAQRRAIAQVRAGVTTQSVDRAARSFIAEKGYGKEFGHGLGHGVGLEAHEDPSIGKHSTRQLKAGMVFTIEPGIYLPGWGGIRIEDMVAVTHEGCRLLTHLPRGLEAARLTE